MGNTNRTLTLKLEDIRGLVRQGSSIVIPYKIEGESVGRGNYTLCFGEKTFSLTVGKATSNGLYATVGKEIVN